MNFLLSFFNPNLGLYFETKTFHTHIFKFPGKRPFFNILKISFYNLNLFSQNSPIHRISMKGAISDPSFSLRFELTENPLGLFRLDSKTGDLFVEWPLDQLIAGDHEILVTAKLGKQSAQRVYTVKISGELEKTKIEQEIETTTVDQEETTKSTEPQEQTKDR